MDNDPQKDLPSTLDVETQESQLSEIPLSDIPLELPTTEPNKPESKPLSLFQRLKNVFFAFLPIGYITFGGPAAHVAIYQEAFVHKRNWVNEAQFSELFALGQSLPGPTSTQMCIAIGTIHAGVLGGILALLLFAFPGFAVMSLTGLLLGEDNITNKFPKWVEDVEIGLACAGVALVAIAAWKLAKKVAPTKFTKALMFVGCAVTIVYRPTWMFPVLMAVGGLTSLVWLTLEELIEKRKKQFNIKQQGTSLKERFKYFYHIVKSLFKKPPPMESKETLQDDDPQKTTKVDENLKYIGISPIVGILILIAFAVLFVVLLIMSYVVDWKPLLMFEAFYRMGSIIFGGGQVVIPMLLAEFNEKHPWVTEQQFFNGLAIVSALPGPMFNLSAYLGAIMYGIPGIFIGWWALFLPGFFFIYGILPWWKKFRTRPTIQKILAGVNAVAIGLVLTAVYLLWNKAVKLDDFAAVIVVIIVGLVGALGVSAPIGVISGGFLGLFFKFLLNGGQ